jgi:hypothetical protein
MPPAKRPEAYSSLFRSTAPQSFQEFDALQIENDYARIAMNRSEAWERFQKSTNIGFYEWHDGVGYDLDAFAAMTTEERDAVAAELCEKLRLDWRDMDVLRIHGSSASFNKLRDALASGTIEERAYALRNLIDMGKMSGNVPDFQLAHVLDDVNGFEGLTTSLRIAREHAGPMSNAALLRGARDRPAVAVLYAGMISFLAGVTDEEFDWNLRPLFLRLGDHSTDRPQAFRELCDLAGIRPESIPNKGSGTGIVFPKGRANS